jgi:zinc protease
MSQPDLTAQVRSVTSRVLYLPGAAVVALGLSLTSDREAERIAAEAALAVETEIASPTTWRQLGQASRELMRLAFVQGEDVDVAEAARWLRATGEADFIAGYQRQVSALRVEALPVAARGALQKGAVRRLLILPLHGSAPDFEELAFILAAAAPRPAGAPGPGPEAVRALLAHPGFALHRRTLPSGLEVVVAPAGAHPTVHVELQVRVAHAGTPPFPAGTAGLALGTAERDWSLSEPSACPEVERKVGAESVAFQLAGPSAELGAKLDALRCATRSGTVGDAFRKVRDEVARRLGQESEHPARVATAAALYPDHPYGSLTSAASIAAVDPGAAERWLARSLRPERSTLLITGRVVPGPELDRMVDEALGDWRAKQPPLDDAPPPPPARRRVVLAAARRISVDLLLGVRLPAGDAAASEAVAHLLEERVRAVLPAESPAGVRRTAGRLGQVLTVAALCAPSRTAETLEKILGEVERLSRGDVGPDEASRARWWVARGLASRHDTGALALADLAAATELGLPLDDAARVEAVSGLGPERLAEVARTLAAGQEVALVAGSSGLAPALRAAGHEVEVVEPAPAQAPAGR